MGIGTRAEQDIYDLTRRAAWWGNANTNDLVKVILGPNFRIWGVIFIKKHYFFKSRVLSREKENSLLELLTLALPTVTIKHHRRIWQWLSSSVPQALCISLRTSWPGSTLPPQPRLPLLHGSLHKRLREFPHLPRDTWRGVLQT